MSPEPLSPATRTGRILFMVPFKLGYAVSGGGIRPGKLIAAFETLGYAVDVVSGFRKQRLQAMAKAMDTIRAGQGYDFIYVESSTLPYLMTEKHHRPFWPGMERKLMRLAKKNRIPIGLFYRDIYWRSKDQQVEVGTFTRLWRRPFFHLDLAYYAKILDVCFVPSLGMKPLFPRSLHDRLVACPPGHDESETISRTAPAGIDDLSFLYVGGLKPNFYDIRPLLSLARQHKVTICCRPEEWEAQHEFYALEKNDPCVVHACGHDLKDLYSRHKVAAIVRRDNPYLRFASPLKFYEAIGQNIPLLVTDGSLAADLVHEWNIGWVMREDLADFSAQQLVDEYGEKLAAITAIKAEHTWSRRAQSIARVLGAAELG